MAVGIGIIGAGGISRAHARAYLQIPDEARIVGVADILEDRARNTHLGTIGNCSHLQR